MFSLNSFVNASFISIMCVIITELVKILENRRKTNTFSIGHEFSRQVYKNMTLFVEYIPISNNVIRINSIHQTINCIIS